MIEEWPLKLNIYVLFTMQFSVNMFQNFTIIISTAGFSFNSTIFVFEVVSTSFTFLRYQLFLFCQLKAMICRFLILILINISHFPVKMWFSQCFHLHNMRGFLQREQIHDLLFEVLCESHFKINKIFWLM